MLNLRDIIRVLLIFSICVAAVSIIRFLGVSGSSALIPSIWGLGALVPTYREKKPLSFVGLTRSNLAFSLKQYLLSTLIIFPLFGGGLLLYHGIGMPIPRTNLPSGLYLTEWIFYQFAVVAIFEELFFRGYLQKKAEEIFRAMGFKEKGSFWLPVITSAFFFGIAHITVELNPARFVVFFPGLLFAWLRARTGSLIAPVLSHGSANVYYMILLNALS